MTVDVELPDLGNDGGDHATVSEWHVDEGDYVKEGEILVELVSDAGTIEVHAPQSGTMLEIVVEEDEVVRVGELLGIIECQEDEDDVEAEEEPVEFEPDVDDDE